MTQETPAEKKSIIPRDDTRKVNLDNRTIVIGIAIGVMIVIGIAYLLHYF